MKIKRVFSLSMTTIIILFLTKMPAQAHKVNVFAYSEGDTIFTDSYFPDGRKVQGGKIEVYDSGGTKLLEGTTDKQGVFNFKTPKKDDLKIVLNATMGHKNSFVLPADEIEAVAASGEATTSEPTQDIVREEVAQPSKSSTQKPRHQVKPPEESHAVAVVAGLGFIFGLTWLILHFTKKKRVKS